MDLERFDISLRAMTSDVEVMDFCRKHILHGTPIVFENRDEEFYNYTTIAFTIPRESWNFIMLHPEGHTC